MPSLGKKPSPCIQFCGHCETPLWCHCETLCQRAICFQAPSSMAKGRGSLHFQTSYPRERFEEKNYRQIPQGMLRYAAPPSRASKFRATPAAGARKDEPRPVTTRLVPRFLCHSLCGHCETLCQRAICFQAPSSMAKGRGSLHFQTSYPRERFEEKNYMQIAAPPSRASKFRATPAAGARKDKLRPVTAPSAVRSLRDPNLVSLRDPLPLTRLNAFPILWQRVVAVCLLAVMAIAELTNWQSAFPIPDRIEHYGQRNQLCLYHVHF